MFEEAVPLRCGGVRQSMYCLNYWNIVVFWKCQDVYADSSVVPPNTWSRHRFHELSSTNTSCFNRPIPSPSRTYTYMNSDISILSSSSDLSFQGTSNPSVPVETHAQNNVQTNQEIILVDNKRNVNCIAFLKEKKMCLEVGCLNDSLFDLQWLFKFFVTKYM